MNWKRILGIVAILAVIAVVFFKLRSNKETTQQRIYQYDKEKPIGVQVDTIKMEFIEEGSFFTGTFEPNKETKVSAEMQGKINAVLVDVGSQVTKGQTLIQLDNALLKLQLQTVDVQIEGLENDLNRFTILAKSDAIQGVQLEKVQLGLKSAKIQRATLMEQISKTTIRAPFNGIVTVKMTEEGAFAAPGMPLIQITDISRLRFTVNVPERELSQFQLNKEYDVLSDVYPEKTLTGKVIMIGSKANMGSSFPIQFEVINTEDQAIKSGMFGKVSSKGSQLEQGIIIPSSAIVEESGNAHVYGVINGKAVLQSIRVSKTVGNKSIVSSGLKADDIIVTNGFINLFDGANVKSINGIVSVDKNEIE